jgi:hypothetical protein
MFLRKMPPPPLYTLFFYHEDASNMLLHNTNINPQNLYRITPPPQKILILILITENVVSEKENSAFWCMNTLSWCTCYWILFGAWLRLNPNDYVSNLVSKHRRIRDWLWCLSHLLKHEPFYNQIQQFWQKSLNVYSLCSNGVSSSLNMFLHETLLPSPIIALIALFCRRKIVVLWEEFPQKIIQ